MGEGRPMGANYKSIIVYSIVASARYWTRDRRNASLAELAGYQPDCKKKLNNKWSNIEIFYPSLIKMSLTVETTN